MRNHYYMRLVSLFTTGFCAAMLSGCLGSSGGANSGSVAPGAQLLVVRGLSKIMSGDCRAYTISAQSTSGVAATLASDSSLALQVGGPGSYVDSDGTPVIKPSQAFLYSDSNCTLLTNNVAVDLTSQSAVVYLQDQHTESLLVYAASSDPTVAGGAIAISTYGATQLSVVGPANTLAGLCTSAFTVNAVDATQTSYIVLANTQVNLSGGAGTFYSDSLCATPITSVMILSGSASTSFYYKGPTPTTAQSIITNEASQRLTGMTVSLAILRPATLAFGTTTAFGNVAIGTSATKTYTISNSGDVSATSVAFTLANSSGTFAYVGGAFPGTGGTCTNTLAKASSCTVVVGITPAIEQAYAGTLALTYNDGVVASQTTTPQTLAATGFFPSGSLDLGFGAAGKATTTVGTDTTRALAIQTDGKIVVASTSVSGTKSSILVSRFTVLGALDTTFNTTGNFVFSSTPNTYVAGVAIDTDGTILIAGTSGDATSSDFLLIRLSATGAVLTQTTHDLNGGSIDTARAMALLPNETIVVGGISGGSYAVMRVKSDLTLDTTFGGSGVVIFAMGANATVNAIAADSAGHIVVAGSGNGNIAFTRLNNDGSFDNTFNSVTSGTPAVTTFGTNLLNQAGAATGLAFTTINNTQRIVASALVGTANLGAVRLTSLGVLDTSFAGNGITAPNLGSSASSGDAIAVDSSGRLLISGKVGTALSVVRLTAAGAKDTTFNSTGFNSATFSSASEGFAIGIQPTSNRIIVGGNSGTSVALARFVP